MPSPSARVFTTANVCNNQVPRASEYHSELKRVRGAAAHSLRLGGHGKGPATEIEADGDRSKKKMHNNMTQEMTCA